MWSLEDGTGEVDAYFKLIEDEANELRKYYFDVCNMFLNISPFPFLFLPRFKS